MGEINFINKEMDTGDNGKNVPPKNVRPPKFIPEDSSSDEKSGSVFASGKNSKVTENKERIEKSRQEVLEIIDKNKNKVKTEKVEGNKIPWFKKIFGGSSEKTPIAQAKQDKEATKQPMNASNSPIKDSPMIFNNNTWNSVGVLETNLMDKTDFSFFDTGKKIRILSMGIFASLFLLACLYLMILFWENMQLEALSSQKDEIVALENEVRSLEADTNEAKEFQARLEMVVKLMDKHIYWSNFFSFLESKTLPNVFFTKGINMGIDKPFSVVARTDDYESVKNQLMILSNDESVSNLKLREVTTFNETISQENNGLDPATTTPSSIAITKSGVEFGLDFDIDDEMLYMANNIVDDEVNDEDEAEVSDTGTESVEDANQE